jgi:hypothetical protein
MRTLIRLFDDHGAELLLIIAAGFILSGCIPQPEPGFETRVSVPVSGEVVFH